MHRLESSLPWIAAAVLGTVLFAVVLLRWGVPWASGRVAQALPPSAGETVSRSTLEFLDRWAFEPSELDGAEVRAIEARLRTRLLPLDARNGGLRYRLHVRDWTANGRPVANALALPSGDIVLTDAFVRLCESEDEMDAVILHEIGHVVERHSLERIVQGTFLGALAMLVTGDGSALADMGVGLGSLLIGSHYSRGHEAEADRYAFERMLEAGIDPTAFATIMGRLERSLSREADEAPDGGPGEGPDETPAGTSDDAPEGGGAMDYLASHPRSADRIAEARRYSACFRRGETRCDPG